MQLAAPGGEGEKLRKLRDSPPGSTRRCRAPRGPGLRAVRTTATNPRAGGRSGNGAAEQQGSRLWVQRSIAVSDSCRVLGARAAPTAAGCAADPPGSAELGSSTNPRTPTSSRPRAPERAGRRRVREQGGGGEVWGRSWELEERRRGAGEKRRRGMERTCDCWRFTRQPRGARESARGRPASPFRPLAGLQPLACVLRGWMDRNCLCPRSLTFAIVCQVLPYRALPLPSQANPNLEPEKALPSTHTLRSPIPQPF